GDGILFDLLQAGGDAGLAEIFLRQHVGGHLRPELRHLDVVELENDRAVGILDFARREPKRDVLVSRLAVFGVAPFNPHVSQAPYGRAGAFRSRRLSLGRPCPARFALASTPYVYLCPALSFDTGYASSSMAPRQQIPVPNTISGAGEDD